MSIPQRKKQIGSNCQGLPALQPKIESWIEELAAGRPGDLVAEYGSPLNVIHAEPFRRNVTDLRNVARSFGIDFEVYFARKANKCIRFVEEMKALGGGVDVASLEELRQVLEIGVAAEKVICTAAVKSRELIECCVANRVTIAIDNEDELRLVKDISRNAEVALRLSGFNHEGNILPSRFGFPISEAGMLKDELDGLMVVGLHFHLDGYDPNQRISAARECLEIVGEFRELGHPVRFLDMGGGLPVCYLEHANEWEHFHAEHRKSLSGGREEITYRNHPLGLHVVEGKVYGKPNTYPFYQDRRSVDWLTYVLTHIQNDIKEMDVQLRCEPGRALLDGAGCTIARVEFVKKRAGSDGDHYSGLAMNRTQCRTGSDDFLIDPIVVKSGVGKGPEIRGYLVGAYCTESELIFLRKFRFPSGIQRGDHVIIPNTAGYFMHFLESRSHQFPLAKNYLYEAKRLDAIDEEPLT